MAVVNRLRAIKYHLMDQKKEVMVGGGVEEKEQRRA